VKNLKDDVSSQMLRFTQHDNVRMNFHFVRRSKIVDLFPTDKKEKAGLEQPGFPYR